jgi:hypothetical protein
MKLVNINAAAKNANIPMANEVTSQLRKVTSHAGPGGAGKPEANMTKDKQKAKP